jgi:ABC-type multidrug transport system fused ATPase/permease subunit
VFLGVRIAVSVLSVIGIGLIPLHKAGVDVPGWPAPVITPGWHNLFSALERQDAQWFLRIADAGYARNDGSAAFFPLYPALVRLVSIFTGGRLLVAATVVSNASFLGALVVLYGLATSEFSEATARTTVLLVAIFPTSFFFLAPYSESTFLLLAVTAFWCARRDRWALAALAAALAAMTRSVGIVLAPALLVEAFQQHRERGVALFPRAAAAAATLAGPLAYLAYWQIRFGDLAAPFDAQRQWQRVATFPLQTLWQAVESAYRYGNVWLIDLVVVGVIVVAAVLGLGLQRPAYSVFVWGGLLIPLSYPFPDRPLLSVPRFVAVLFPAFWILADLAERRRIPRTALIATFAAGLSVLTVLFVNWYDIF